MSTAPNDDGLAAGKKVSRRKSDSATYRELRKCHVFNKAVDAYRDIRGRFTLFQTVTEKVEEKSLELCQTILYTRLGRIADKMMAPLARKLSFATRRFAVMEPEETEDNASSIFHLAFRYWPPAMMARWGVDASFGLATAVLALMKDVYPCIEYKPEENQPEEVEEDIGDGSPSKETHQDLEEPEDCLETMPPSLKEEEEVQGEVEEGEETEDQDETAEEVVSEPEVEEDENWNDNLDLILEKLSLLGWVLKGVVTVGNVTLRLVLGLLIPLVTVITLMLYRLSTAFHDWSGLRSLDTAEQQRDWERLVSKLVNKVKDNDQGQIEEANTEWLFDAVLDRHVGSLESYFLFRQLFAYLHVERPIRVAGDTADKAKRLLTKNGPLVSYLQEDPHYDESDDPSYEPEVDEESDDSLEYYEDDDGLQYELGMDVPSASDQGSMSSATLNPEATRRKGVGAKRIFRPADDVDGRSTRRSSAPSKDEMLEMDNQSVAGAMACARSMGFSRTNENYSGKDLSKRAGKKKLLRKVTRCIVDNNKLLKRYDVQKTGNGRECDYVMNRCRRRVLNTSPENFWVGEEFNQDPLPGVLSIPVHKEAGGTGGSRTSDTEFKVIRVERPSMKETCPLLTRDIAFRPTTEPEMEAAGNDEMVKEMIGNEGSSTPTKQRIEKAEREGQSPVATSLQKSPRIREFCENPGQECRNVLEVDEGLPSSSVDDAPPTTNGR